MMVTFNDDTFQESIREKGLTLVDFGAVWCPPCKTLKPILEELGEEQGEKLAVIEVDCDESPETASRFGVMSMPTVLLFHNGEPVEKLIGLRPKSAYENLLAKYV
ncbi:thioredoxin [Cohnella terricola]|uniref:Thioredoxin n=1 Tax=Cohnella terricola TaxID=1289167 RepID=A0A559JQR7_9BACL|nr:thioredoxin [Cohnella terricola]TVY02224.1 thioredoxin [Cohnella terricola]